MLLFQNSYARTQDVPKGRSQSYSSLNSGDPAGTIINLKRWQGETAILPACVRVSVGKGFWWVSLMWPLTSCLMFPQEQALGWSPIDLGRVKEEGSKFIRILVSRLIFREVDRLSQRAISNLTLTKMNQIATDESLLIISNIK